MTLAKAYEFTRQRRRLQVALLETAYAAASLKLTWEQECERLSTAPLVSHETAEQRARVLARAITKREQASEVWARAVAAHDQAQALLST